MFTEETGSTVTQQSNAHTQNSLFLPTFHSLQFFLWLYSTVYGLCFGLYRRHMLRDRRPCTTACPDCWPMGTHKVKKCAARKKIFCTVWLEQPRQDKNSLYQHDEPHEPTTEGPLHLYSVSPHLSRFQQSAGATPLWSLLYIRSPEQYEGAFSLLWRKGVGI